MKADKIVIALKLCDWGPYEYISTKKVFVDPLTKGLRSMLFMKHVKNIGLVKSFDVLS